jgi:flagellar basal body-associated protein FliL
MSEKVERKNRMALIVVILLLIVTICVVSFWFFANRNQSEACKKWEEIKAQTEQQRRQMKASNPEIQQGVSIMQAQEKKYLELCQESQ